jgi:hypothetical protein
VPDGCKVELLAVTRVTSAYMVGASLRTITDIKKKLTAVEALLTRCDFLNFHAVLRSRSRWSGHFLVEPEPKFLGLAPASGM